MTSPSVDPVGSSGHGSGSAVTGGTGSGVSSLTTIDFTGINTFNTNDIILVLVTWSNAGGTVRTLSSLTVGGGAHGPYTQHQRSAFVSTPRSAGATLFWIEVPNQEQGTPITFTATMSGTCDHICIEAVAYTGCHDITAPFDPNSGLSNSGAGTWANYTSAIGSGYSTSAFSTTNANNRLLFLQGGGFASGPTSATATGYTNDKSGSNTAGSDWSFCGISSLGVSSTQSGATTAFTVGTNGGGTGSPIFIAMDALTADATSSTETGTVSMALSKVSFSAAAGREETATATVALSKVSFNSTGIDVRVSGAVTMVLNKIAMLASSLDFKAGSIFNSFSTFGA